MSHKNDPDDQPMNPNELLDAMQDLQGSDRAVGIVGAALVEARLEEFLRRQFVYPNSATRKRADNMLKPSQALGSFSVKIDLGVFLGLYGTEAWADLVRIKDIRNAFAHKPDCRSFDHAAVASKCKSLSLVEKSVSLHDRVLERAYKIHDRQIGSRMYPYSLPNPLDSLRGRYAESCWMFIHLLMNAQYREDDYPRRPPCF